MIKRLSTLPILILLLMASGCGTHVTVKGDFPDPLSTPLPLKGGLVLDQEFQQHVYADRENRKLTFAIGAAQTAMLRSIGKGLFTQVHELDAVTDPGGEDLILVPAVEEIQVAMPFETQLKVFEVWLKYNISVYDSQGQPVADWIMTAYGKTPSRFLSSDEEALNQAAIVALRDAGARLLVEFHRLPEIDAWLQNAGHRGQP